MGRHDPRILRRGPARGARSRRASIRNFQVLTEARGAAHVPRRLPALARGAARSAARGRAALAAPHRFVRGRRRRSDRPPRGRRLDARRMAGLRHAVGDAIRSTARTAIDDAGAEPRRATRAWPNCARTRRATRTTVLRRRRGRSASRSALPRPRARATTTASRRAWSICPTTGTSSSAVRIRRELRAERPPRRPPRPPRRSGDEPRGVPAPRRRRLGEPRCSTR